MNGEKNLEVLLKSMKPKHNVGEFVFCNTKNVEQLDWSQVIMMFREDENITIITHKEVADKLNIE